MSKDRAELRVVTGTVVWSSLTTPNKLSGKYELTIAPHKESMQVLKEAHAQPARDREGKPKTDDNGVALFKFKRSHKITLRDTGEVVILEPPRVVDCKNNPVTKLVGKGSTVKVAFTMRPWKAAGKSGISADLHGVRVLTLVEYVPKNTAMFSDEDDGYTEDATDTGYTDF